MELERLGASLSSGWSSAMQQRFVASLNLRMGVANMTSRESGTKTERGTRKQAEHVARGAYRAGTVLELTMHASVSLREAQKIVNVAVAESERRQVKTAVAVV